MQRDKISARQQLVQFYLGDTDLRGAFFREERVISHNLHLEAKRT